MRNNAAVLVWSTRKETEDTLRVSKRSDRKKRKRITKRNAQHNIASKSSAANC